MSSPAGSKSMTCPRCGRAVDTPGLCGTCRSELEPQTTIGSDSATVLGSSASQSDVTRLTPPAGAGPVVTRLTPPPIDSDATRLTPPIDEDATQLTPPPIDPDATRLTPPPVDPEATQLGTRRIDPDATQLGAPTSASTDATRLTPPIGLDTDATQLAPGLNKDVTRLSPGAPPTPRSVNYPGESGPLHIGEEFGRYTIVRMLGIGGMGAVYQAWDKELEVVVALKVIRPEISQDPAAEAEIERRFKRELLLARQVTHKNVVRIHDLGEIRGIKYITMSYVDGTDLSTLIKRVGRLPISKILNIMRSVVSGLVAAHGAGVVHRDLKPANIMIDSHGDALIMDFGIARSTGTSGDLPGSATAGHAAPPAGIRASGKYTDATVLGAIVGTIEYMAPEQARAQPVDQRADIYATGLILYDMLTGKRRGGGAGTALDELKGRMDGAPPAIKSIVPDVPDAVAAVVTKATESDPTKRYQTTVELLAALDRLDDHGVPKPIKRAVSLPIAAGIAAVLVALAVAGWWYGFGRPTVPVVHAPESVLIADFENRTGDSTFDQTLEPTLRRALEGAGFITAYDRNGIKRTLAVTLPAKLDETATKDIAVKQGLGVVVSGAIEKQGNGFAVTMKATRVLQDKVIADLRSRAPNKEGVIAAVTDLAGSVREALGDTESTSNPLFNKASLSAASLDAVRYYASAMDNVTNNKFEDARASLLKAVEADPNFGVGYQVLAVVSRNLGQVQQAQDYINQAMAHVDGMTERERYTTRGMLFRITGDNKQCAEVYGALVDKFKADVIGRNQRAICEVQLRHIDTAIDEMKEVVKIIPKRVAFRVNLALYSDYFNDFETGEKEGNEAVQLNGGPEAYGSLAIAFAQLATGRLEDAAATYRSMAPARAPAPTFSSSGLGDLAIYQGRYAEAIRILGEGATAEGKNTDSAARKVAAQAYAQLMRGQKAAAIAAADRALSLNQGFKIRFLAGRIYIEAGRADKAKPLISSLSAELQPEPQNYGKSLEALIAINSTDAKPAVKLLTDAIDLLDTWINHFDLGRAYLALGQFPQADSEFDRANARRGEALALFLDEEATFGFFPPLHYYWGRALEGQSRASAKDSYQTYIDLRGKAGEDVLLADARKRLAGLKNK